MQNLHIKESELPEKKGRQTVSLWSRSGPALLLGSFAVFLFKCAPFYWPLVLTAFLGYAAIRLLQRSGLLLSLIVLCGASIYILRSGNEPLWTSILAVSIACSWLLIYLGGLDGEALTDSRENRILCLEAELVRLEKQLRDKGLALSEQRRQSSNEKQHLSAQIAELALSLTQERQSLETSAKEREKLREECEILSQDIFTHLQKESASKHALESAQDQFAELKKQFDELTAQRIESKVDIEIEETSDEDHLRLEQVQHQFALLREQFEEKSETLDQTRKDLFKVENDFLSLQKAWEEKNLEPSEEAVAFGRDLKTLEDQCSEMENQVIFLQDFISSLLFPKKRPRAKKSKQPSDQQELLPDLIQTKIDHKVKSKR